VALLPMGMPAGLVGMARDGWLSVWLPSSSWTVRALHLHAFFFGLHMHVIRYCKYKLMEFLTPL